VVEKISTPLLHIIMEFVLTVEFYPSLQCRCSAITIKCCSIEDLLWFIDLNTIRSE
jgi:hypothetical protein